jgi:hypothetical protein
MLQHHSTRKHWGNVLVLYPDELHKLSPYDISVSMEGYINMTEPRAL